MPASELAGVWRLISFHDIDDEGIMRQGPLGPCPRGMLFYTADGHVSVTMMRAPYDRDAAGAEHEEPKQNYMSYAGTWRRTGNQVFHSLTVAPNPQWLGTEQVRDLVLEGDRLTLRGNSLSRPNRRILQWERIERLDTSRAVT